MSDLGSLASLTTDIETYIYTNGTNAITGAILQQRLKNIADTINALIPTDYAASVHTHASTQISDSTATGRSLLTASDASAARSVLGATSTGGAVFTAATRAAASIAVLPSYSGNASKVLAVNTGETDVEWVTASGGSGVSDGDKGDITVSSSGSVWTIDNGVVSTSKMGGDVTTAGKALLDDADAAAQRTTLGLGTAALENIKSAKVTTTQSTTSTSFVDITELSVALEANKLYAVTMYLMCNTASTSNSLICSINGPASPNEVSWRVRYPLSTTSQSNGYANAYNAEPQTPTTAPSGAYLIQVDGIINNGANAGNLVGRFKSEVGNTASIKPGSYMVVTKLN